MKLVVRKEDDALYLGPVAKEAIAYCHAIASQTGLVLGEVPRQPTADRAQTD